MLYYRQQEKTMKRPLTQQISDTKASGNSGKDNSTNKSKKVNVHEVRRPNHLKNSLNRLRRYPILMVILGLMWVFLIIYAISSYSLNIEFATKVRYLAPPVAYDASFSEGNITSDYECSQEISNFVLFLIPYHF